MRTNIKCKFAYWSFLLNLLFSHILPILCQCEIVSLVFATRTSLKSFHRSKRYGNLWFRVPVRSQLKNVKVVFSLSLSLSLSTSFVSSMSTSINDFMSYKRIKITDKLSLSPILCVLCVITICTIPR